MTGLDLESVNLSALHRMQFSCLLDAFAAFTGVFNAVYCSVRYRIVLLATSVLVAAVKVVWAIQYGRSDWLAQHVIH